MKVLLTGGAGFIGSHVAEALVQRGDQVTVLDSFDTFYDPAIKRRTAERLAKQGVGFVEGDLRNLGDVEKAFAAAGQGAGVIHLAARAGVRPSIAQPLLYSEVNVDGTTNMLEVARKVKAARFIFASSSSVYGGRETVPFREDDPVDRPISPYAATKKAGEVLCYTYHHLHGIHVSALRFFTVYGPRQRPEMAIHKFATMMARGQEIPVYGDGGSARDYTYVDDIVQGTVASLDRCEGYEIYNLGESHTTRLDELVDKLSRALGIPAKVRREPEQPGDVPITYADISKARARLGYAPTTLIDEGLARFAEWFHREGVR